MAQAKAAARAKTDMERKVVRCMAVDSFDIGALDKVRRTFLKMPIFAS
jgi:hypothetical protein